MNWNEGGYLPMPRSLFFGLFLKKKIFQTLKAKLPAQGAESGSPPMTVLKALANTLAELMLEDEQLRPLQWSE